MHADIYSSSEKRKSGRGIGQLLASILTCLVIASSAQGQERQSFGRPSASAVQMPAGNARNRYAGSRQSLHNPALLQRQSDEPIPGLNDPERIYEIEMFVGESRLLPAPGVVRIAVGNGQIMTATALDKKEVAIFANAVGTSSLFVWNQDGVSQRVKVTITPGDTSRIAREVAAFLATIPDAKASIVGDKVIVEGDSLSDADLAKVEQLGMRYPQIVNFTNRLGWELMVMMDVKVVEFPVTELRDIGIKWSTAGGAAIGAIWGPIRRGDDGPYQINIPSGQDTPAPIVGQNASGPAPVPPGLNVLGAVNLGLNAQLNLLAQEGKTVILAEPQLSTRNGAKASFLAGGEFPYIVSTINGPSVFFKPYGVKLDILPRVGRNGAIRATVEYEVSSIDDSIKTAAGPALRTRKTSTEFNVKSGETIVLSGLLQREDSTNIDKLPFLGDVPILGALFRSKRYQNKETELVVFVTPSVVDSRSPDMVDRVNRTNARLQRNFGKPPYLRNTLQPKRDPSITNEPVSKSVVNTHSEMPLLSSDTLARLPSDPPIEAK